MIFTRVKMYYKNQFVMEHCYLTDSHVKAIERFYRDYPKYRCPDCNAVAETFDSEDPKYEEWFKTCIRCGCVN